MPNDYPGVNDVHVNALLTNMSIGYKNNLLIADKIAPMVMVPKRSNIVPAYDKSHWYRIRAKNTTEREAPPVSGYSVDTSDTYYCKERSAAHFISDARRANTDMPFNADRDGTMWVADALDLYKEYYFVQNFWKTGVWGTDKTGGVDFTKWSTYATSTPIHDLRGYIRIVTRATGRRPTKLVLGDLAYDTLIDHPNTLDRVESGGSSGDPATFNARALAEILELDEVLVGQASYTADPEGTAEASVTYTHLWDDDALLLYTTSAPSLFNPSAMYTFGWTQMYGGARLIKQRRDPQSDKGDLIEGLEYWDMKVTAASAGVFISDAVD